MRLFLLGPRLFGARTGISIGREDFVRRNRTISQPAQQDDPDKSNFLYVIRSADGLCKIGRTSNPDRRLLQLQYASTSPLSFAWIGAPEGEALAIERNAHAALASFRRSGEWFETTDDICVAAICGAAQRRHQNILSCSPDLARRIIQVGLAQDALATKSKQSPIERFAWTVVQLLFGAVLALVLLFFVAIRIGRVMW
jgi:T5orf172 domain